MGARHVQADVVNDAPLPARYPPPAPASGAVLPAFLLLRMAYRWLAAPKIGPQGLHLLSGLVGIGIGALILWLVCSFSD